MSLSSSSRDSSSSSRHSPLAPHLLGQPGPHQQKLGPGPSIAQVKPSERVNRAVTRSDSDSDVSRSISPPSFSPQCLDKNSNCKKNATSEPASRRKQAAKEVCKLPPKLRTSAALSHPDFVSTCWAHSDCPPPVLTASQVVDIEGGEVETCRRAVDRLLVQVEQVVMIIVWANAGPQCGTAYRHDPHDPHHAHLAHHGDAGGGAELAGGVRLARAHLRLARSRSEAVRAASLSRLQGEHIIIIPIITMIIITMIIITMTFIERQYIYTYY